VWAEIGLLLAGAVCAGLGGELFVRGAVRAATWLHIRPGLIGATVAAFATSGPELAVALTAALDGAPAIALGNALGANAVNLGLALGLSLLLGPSEMSQGGVRRDLPAALVVPVLIAVFLVDRRLARPEAAILLAVFVAWLVLSIRQERETPEARVPFSRRERARTAGLLVAGVALLLVSGEAFVAGAVGLADRFGWDRFIVGATLVALGTTMPELATSVVAKLRGHDEVGLGTLLGSCLFNGAFIVPAAALITPPEVAFDEVAVALGAGVLLVLAAIPRRGAPLGRARGVLMIALYAGYVAALVLR
jgi:cation:H+ antiporter